MRTVLKGSDLPSSTTLRVWVMPSLALRPVSACTPVIRGVSGTLVSIVRYSGVVSAVVLPAKSVAVKTTE